MNVDLHHQQYGTPDGPSVILLGALGSDVTMWEPQIGALAGRYSVVAVDLRGHGESPAPHGPYTIAELAGDVIALLDKLEIHTAHIVGVSLGSVVGQSIAARHPLRVQTLTLLGPSSSVDPSDHWIDEALAVRTAGTISIAADVMDRWFTKELAVSDPDLFERHLDVVRTAPDEGYAACCEALSSWDGGAQDRARIVAPTLLIDYRQALAVPEADGLAVGAWSAEIANSETHAVNHGGQLANIEQAGRVTRLLLEHLSAYTRATRETGMRIRRNVLGDAHVDQSMAGATEFTEPFQDFITRTAWGDIWSRPGLDHRTRRLLTLAILTAVGNEHELDMHIRAALRAGIAAADLIEVFLHTAIYAGVPNSNLAFALGKKAIADLTPDAPKA